eukprot:768341-Hanusia_phi.AAC.3
MGVGGVRCLEVKGCRGLMLLSVRGDGMSEVSEFDRGEKVKFDANDVVGERRWMGPGRNTARRAMERQAADG